jgi:histidyl-tRNA synthetase
MLLINVLNTCNIYEAIILLDGELMANTIKIKNLSNGEQNIVTLQALIDALV